MTYTDLDIIRFGKYKGKRLGDLPPDYLQYLFDHVKNLEIGLKKYIQNKIENNK